MVEILDFVDRERAKELVRKEPVVFAEIMGEGTGEQSLEVHVMRGADRRGAPLPVRDRLSRGGSLSGR